MKFIVEISQERCDKLNEVCQPGESTRCLSQASTEEDEDYGHDLGDSDDSDSKIEYTKLIEHDRCDWACVLATPLHAFGLLVQKCYLSVGESVHARKIYRKKGSFNLVIFAEVTFDDIYLLRRLSFVFPPTGPKHTGHQKMRI